MSLVLLLLISSSIISFVLLYLVFSNCTSNDEKELIFIGSLGGPLVLPLVTIILWILFFLRK